MGILQCVWIWDFRQSGGNKEEGKMCGYIERKPQAILNDELGLGQHQEAEQLCSLLYCCVKLKKKKKHIKSKLISES